MFSKLKAGFQKAGKGLEKAGHNVKGGLEKAGQNIKKNVEEANRSVADARSHNSSPSKKKSELKSSGTTHDNKSEKPHTTATTRASSEHNAEGASTSAAPSHHSATRASSVHSSRASVKEGETAGAADPTPVVTPAAPRSRAGTPTPPPPPPPLKTPKRASEKAPVAAAAAAPPPPQPTTVHARTPSEESGNSLHFSDADDLETPGSIQFSVEPGSALKKTPAASPQQQRQQKPSPHVRHVKEEEKEEDLTATESSLDIVVEEDDDDTSTIEPAGARTAAHAADEETAVAEGMPSAKAKKSGEEKKPSVKTAAVASEGKSQGSTATSSSRKLALTAAKEGKTGGGRKSTPPRPTGKGKAEAVESKSKPATSSRSSKHEVTFADEGAALGDRRESRKRRQGGKSDRDAKREGDGAEKKNGTPAPTAAAKKAGGGTSSRRRSPSQSSSSSGNSASGHREGKENIEEPEGEEEERSERRRRRHRGFRLSPARSEGSEINSEEEQHQAQRPSRRSSRERSSKKSRSHRSSRDRHESPSSHGNDDDAREQRRDSRNRNERRSHGHTSPAEKPASHSQQGRSSQRRYEYDGGGDRALEEEAERHRQRKDSAAAATASASTPPPAAASTRRRGSSHRRTPISLLDGGALVEECLRDTEGYARAAPLQRRSAVQSTYQQDYPDWSRGSDRGDDYDNDYAGGGGGSVTSATYRVPQGRGGAAASTSPYRPAGRRGGAAAVADLSPSFHRLSFYDEDDALAAEAVAEPARFRAHSADRESRSRRRQGRYVDDDDAEAGGEEVRPRGRSRSRSAAERYGRDNAEGLWQTRQRTYEVAGRRSRNTTPHYAPYPADRHGVVSPSGSSRHVYDAVRPRSPPHTSSRGRRSSEHLAEESRNSASSWHRIPEEHADPDYYFSDAPRERRNSGSWQSRSRRSAFGASPPRSPLWAHRSSFGRAAQEEEFSPTLRRLQRLHGVGRSTGTTALSPLRGRRVDSALRSPLRSSHAAPAAGGSAAPSPVRSEGEILEEVEWKLDVLGQQILAEDADREEAMLRSPFERLYHLNNRRDRDERRKKVFQLNRLERIRDRIVSGSLEEDIARREERLRKQQEMLSNPNGVFLRLYQNTSGRRSTHAQSTVLADSSRHSTPQQQQQSGRASASHNNTSNMSKGSSRPGSATRRTLSREQRLAMCDRLYGGALAGKGKKEEVSKQSAEDRRRREVEELLVARLVAQLQLEHTQLRPKEKKRPLTFDELEAAARRKLETLRQEDPTGYEAKVLRGRVLTPKEQGLASQRLFKQGYVTKESLAARKAKDELKGCTFQPATNDYAAFGGRKTNRSKKNDEDSDEGGDDGSDSRSTDASSSSDAGERHRGRHAEADRCKELYRKGMKAKTREAELKEEYDREMRLKILRGRMASDHHFRRRVELDPSLAERFMKSLIV